MTNNLPAYARQSGGYVAAAMLEDDIADQYTGLGDPFFDALAEQHRSIARALRRAASGPVMTFPTREA